MSQIVDFGFAISSASFIYLFHHEVMTKQDTPGNESAYQCTGQLHLSMWTRKYVQSGYNPFTDNVVLFFFVVVVVEPLKLKLKIFTSSTSRLLCSTSKVEGKLQKLCQRLLKYRWLVQFICCTHLPVFTSVITSALLCCLNTFVRQTRDGEPE